MSDQKKYKVYWSFQANEDLADIYAYIEEDAPTAADKVIDTLLELGNSLETFPERFSIELNLEDAPTVFRFIPKWHYKIIYTVKKEDGLVIIARVFHTSQDADKLTT